MKYLPLLLSVLLTSCSKLNIAVNYAPRFIANKLDDSFDFSSERYDKVKASIENDLNQHKKELFKVLIAKFNELHTLSLKKDPTLEDFRKNTADLKNLQRQVVEAFRQSFSEVLLTLSKKEFEHFKKFSNEKFKDHTETVNDHEKYKKRALKFFNQVMETLFDSVTKEQEKIYSDFIENNYAYFQGQVPMRREYLQQFELLLDNRPELVNRVLRYYSGDGHTGDFAVQQKKLLENISRLQMDLWASTTTEQKNEFRKTMLKYKDELQEMLNKK